MSDLLLPRRGLLAGLASLIAAPALVRVSSLMSLRGVPLDVSPCLVLGAGEYICSLPLSAPGDWFHVSNLSAGPVHVSINGVISAVGRGVGIRIETIADTRRVVVTDDDLHGDRGQS